MLSTNVEGRSGPTTTIFKLRMNFVHTILIWIVETLRRLVYFITVVHEHEANILLIKQPKKLILPGPGLVPIVIDSK